MNASNASADLVMIQSGRITALEDEIEGLRSRLADAEMILSDAFLEHDETGVCRPCQAEKDASDFLKASADPVIRAPRDWHNPDDLVTIRDLRNQCEMWSDACAMVEMNRDQLRAERDALRAALGEIAANRCGLCGIVTETPCKHEGDWMKCPNKHEPFRFNPRAIAKAALAARGKDE